MDYSGKIIRKTPVVPSQQSASGVWQLDEAMQATKNNTWPVANVPNPISRSLRIRSSASAYLSRTFSSASTNNKILTYSVWVKRGILSTADVLVDGYDGSSAAEFQLSFDSSDRLDFTFGGASAFQLTTTAVYRDPSAWYHVVMAIDTTQATSSNRVKLYVNGVQITAFSTANYPSLNATSQFPALSGNNKIGSNWNNTSGFFDGYMTEINFIDGQALTPASFGGTNAATGVWEPRQYTGTYGTNGFYLNFKDNTSTTTLGYDYSGNNNTWTTNNISLTAGSTYDSMLDVPTQWIGYGNAYETTRGNYATFNPILYMGTGSVKSNGNLRFAGGGTGGPPYNYSIYSTFTQNTGKWYWETTIATVGGQAFVGMFNTAINFTGTSLQSSAGPVLYGNDGNYYNETSPVSFGATYTTGDVIGVAVDYDNNLIWFSKNGTFQNSGVPATGTNGKTFGSGKTWGTGYVESGSSVSPSTYSINFGQQPFTYTPPAGFLSLCTTNLPSPTILQGDDYFNILLWTGDDTNPRSFTGLGFQPDFVWAKRRNTTGSNWLMNSVCGTQRMLASNSTDAEDVNSANGSIQSFDADGFTFQGSSTNDNFNNTGDTLVGWSWKASNAAAVSNVAGTITSSVSANTTAGFSIVTYTGNGTNSTVGHGLGVAPSFIIFKNRTTSPRNWIAYHASLGATVFLEPNTTAAQNSDSTQFNNTAPTSTVFSVGSSTNTNQNSNAQVAYCFAAVPGYSAISSYTGNGSTNGTFIFTGFRPRYLMVKRTDTTANWTVYDTSRSPYNQVELHLRPNTNQADDTGTSEAIDILSNGFKLKGTSSQTNASGGTYIYYAVAENPFKNALAR